MNQKRYYRVLLVDDEKTVLENMRSVIDWESFGFTVCGTLESGEQACRLLEEQKVDLVITDVMMPQMTGIELAEHICHYYPKTEMIIISGYDEFDYARCAMRAGVMEYITKPTEKAELERALQNAARRIQRRTELDQNLKKLKEAAQKQIPVLKNQYFSDLSNQIIPEGQNLFQTLRYYHSPLNGEYYQLWCFELDRGEQYEDIPEMRELLWAQLNMLIREIVDGKLTYDSFAKGQSLYYIVERGAQESMEDLLEQILSEFQNLTRSSVSVAVSREYEGYDKLYLARRDCEIALEERCNLGEGSCIFYEEIQMFPDGGFAHNHELLNQICVKIRAQNKISAKALIEKMYAQMQENKAIYPQFYSQTILILTELFNVATKEETRERIRREMGILYEYKTVDMLQSIVFDIMEEIIQKASVDTAGKNKAIMEQIVEYVDQHIGEEIALADVADAVHLSKNYLCSIFKKEKGETFFNYLMKVRMEKAKQLLRKTDHKVYVIAEMVGYTDYPYFSQVFKKYVGVTAGEYREIYAGE